MTYVGATPTTGDFKKLDSITTSSTTTFNLRQGGVAVYPQSANHCLVVLNGVLQTAGSSFNIVNDTIVFASSLSSSDVINQILVLGNVNDIGVPSDDTVSTAKLQSSSVTDAKISAMATSKLTGTVSQSQIADQAINEAKLQVSNAPTNGYMLTAQSGNTGGLTWAEAGGGDLVKLASSSDFDGAAAQFYATDIFSSTYDNYLVTGFIAPSNNAELRLRWTTGGGTTQYTTSDYNWVHTSYYVDSSHGKATVENGYHAESYIPFCVADIQADNDSSAGSFTFTISDPATTILSRPYIHGTSSFRNNTSHRFYTERFAGTNESNVNATGFMIYPHSGNIRDHSICVYGFKK